MKLRLKGEQREGKVEKNRRQKEWSEEGEKEEKDGGVKEK